jgi:hypothetical protein
MKTLSKLFLASTCVGTICFTSLQAHDGHDNDQQSTDNKLNCSQDVILAFYPAEFVKVTLKKYNVPEDQWEAIVAELGNKEKNVVSSIEKKASQMNPNPLRDSASQAVAVKLFRETLLENFSEVMEAHGYKDEKNLQMMLDDIQMQKAKRFAECFPVQNTQKE